MGLNNKKYLDYAGLEKLVDMHAVVPHPQVEITEEGAYKIAFDEHGHITSKSPLTAADLGLDKAMHFVGVSTTDPLSATGATVADHTKSFIAGDVCIYKRTQAAGDNGQGDHYDDDPTTKTTELYYEEYIYTGTAWELLGDASSYALKEVTISGDGTYITGGGDISTNRTLSHKTYTAADPAIKAIGRDSGGHVVIGKGIIVQGGGGGVHDHDVEVTVPANTFVTDVSANKTKLSINPTKNSVITGIPGTFSHLGTTGITPIDTTTTKTASYATASTAKDVAKAGTAVVYGTADVDTKVSVAQQASAQTLVGNADVGDAVVYGTADVDSQITVDAGKADVGTAVTGLAKRASTQTTIGNANVGTGTTVASGSVTSVSAPVISVKVNSTSKAAYNADYVEADECLVLTPVTITATAPTVTLGTKTIKEAVASENKIWGVNETTASVTPAVASNRTVSFTPAKAADTNRKLTPAKAVSNESTKIYGVSGSVDITPAKPADTSRKIVPAVANGTITPYTFTDIAVPVPTAKTVTVATGKLTTANEGDEVMTGLGDISTIEALTAASIVSGTSGVEVATGVDVDKNTQTTLEGTTDEYTYAEHTHTLAIDA